MIHCAVCGTRYDAGGWRALPVTQELSPSRVRVHLSVPAEWTIEVRRCRCGSQLARRAAS